MIDVAIVGAGFSGIGMALALQKSGRDSFVVLERAADVGGTWRENIYPGVACDVPAHLYRFADHPRADWSRTFARGNEIQEYLRGVVREQGLTERIRLRSDLMTAHWTGGLWRLEVGGANPRTVEAQSLVLACGRLTQPRLPEIAGLASFTGEVMHTARWDHSAHLAGRRVAVAGTGASAVQLVPELVRRGAFVTLFQRTPAWILPRGDVAYDAAALRSFAADPDSLEHVRQRLYDEGEQRFASRSGDEDAASRAQDAALLHLASQVPDAALRHLLTPDYRFGCKRVLLSDDFYPALSSGAVQLEPSALVATGRRTAVAASGATHDADLLVFATGFEASRQPYAELVTGEHGQTLADHWAEGMTSLGSTLVTGFPDLYVLNGPNASLGHNSAVLMAEEQAAFVVRCLTMRESAQNGAPLRIQPEAEAGYTREIDARGAGTPWVEGGCRNWYVDERSGRLTLLWPGTVADFRARLAAIGPSDFESGPVPVLPVVPVVPVVPDWVVIVPVKPAEYGKSRLRVDGVDRRGLARAVAVDTVRAAAEAPGVGAVIVVTDDPGLAREIRSIDGVRVVAERGRRGVNGAVAWAAATIDSAAPRAALLGDLPALRSEDLVRALALAATVDRAVVPDAEGTGSTLVTARAGVELTTAFGENSLLRHVESGCSVIEVDPGSTLRRDVDTAEHLGRASDLGLGARTRAVLEPARTLPGRVRLETG